jgi:hypothetical protein
MSLKAFHIFFITLSVLLALGCAIWTFVSGAEPAFGIAALLIAAGLVVYGVAFRRKARTIIT